MVVVLTACALAIHAGVDAAIPITIKPIKVKQCLIHSPARGHSFLRSFISHSSFSLGAARIAAARYKRCNSPPDPPI
jgi:hypothetical protein